MKHISMKQLFWLAGEYLKKTTPNIYEMNDKDKTAAWAELKKNEELLRNYLMFVWDDRKEKSL